MRSFAEILPRTAKIIVELLNQIGLHFTLPLEEIFSSLWATLTSLVLIAMGRLSWRGIFVSLLNASLVSYVLVFFLSIIFIIVFNQFLLAFIYKEVDEKALDSANKIFAGILEPDIELAKNHNLSSGQLKEIENIIEVHYDEFKSAWKRHLGG